MGVEIEAKMRLSDPEALASRLRAAGAVHRIDVLETNTFFDTPAHSLRESDQGLRLRVEQQVDGDRRKIVITHKGPRAQGLLKSRMETEVIVNDEQAAETLLTNLGFSRVMSFQKRRDRWALDGCLVEIDRVPYLGTFVEIEGPSEKDILAVREKLGLGQEPIVRGSYIAMLVKYVQEHGIGETFLKLG